MTLITDAEAQAAFAATEPEPERDPAFFFTWRGIDFEWGGGSVFRGVLNAYRGWTVGSKGRRWSARIEIADHSVTAEGATPERALEAALCLWVIHINNALVPIAPGVFVIDGKELRTFNPEHAL